MGAWCVCARTCCRTSSSAARAPATRSCEHAQKDLAEDVHMHMAILWKGLHGRAARVRWARRGTSECAHGARSSPIPTPVRSPVGTGRGIGHHRTRPASRSGGTYRRYPSFISTGPKLQPLA